MNEAKNYLIAIDDGHGMNTAGKRTPNFIDGSHIKENQFNRPCSIFLEQALKRCGFRTLQVAPEIEDTPLKTRTNRANNAKANAFVSIHFNAWRGVWQTQAKGISVHVYPNMQGSRRLGEAALKFLLMGTPQNNRGIVSSDFHVLRETYMDAILVENGFMDYEPEASLMLNESYQKEQAEEICQGVCEYYNVLYIKESVPIPVENLNWEQIVDKVALQPTDWKEAINVVKAAAEAEGNLGALEIFKFLQILIEKIYNSR